MAARPNKPLPISALSNFYPISTVIPLPYPVLFRVNCIFDPRIATQSIQEYQYANSTAIYGNVTRSLSIEKYITINLLYLYFLKSNF